MLIDKRKIIRISNQLFSYVWHNTTKKNKNVIYNIIVFRVSNAQNKKNK